MIEVKHLSKKYGTNLAVDDLSFTVESGKIYGFLGPNGAGKSTTMNIITGCLAPTSGEVYISGHSIIEEPVEAKSHIGYLPELPPLYTDMTPREYLTFVAEAKGVRKDKIGGEVALAMKETAVTGVADRLIRNLSKGYRQRVGIAMAMIGDPDIIILDEPTVGLDPQQIIEIRDLIKSLGRDRTVILSSHILTEVASVCDNIIVISRGKLVANDTMEAIAASLRSENIMNITVKANADEVKSVLSAVEGISSYAITEEGEESTSAVVKYPTELDLRETVSFAFSDIRRAVLSMTVEEEDLESIFLKLTESPAESAESDEDEDADEYEDEYESDGEYDEEDADGEEESYVYDPQDYLTESAEVAAEYTDEDDNEDESSDETSSEDDSDDDYKPLFGGK